MVEALTVSEWFFLWLAVLLLGMAKGGLKGIDIFNIIISSLILGSKISTGFILPLLCIADIFAVVYYRRYIHWQYIHKLIYWIITGILIGVFVGKIINDIWFNHLMAIIILISVYIIYKTEIQKKNIQIFHPAVSAGFGLATGFTTMIGNLAGSFANLYFLSAKVDKNQFIGTTAMLFLIINYFKLPFQIFYWNNINKDTLLLNLYTLPALFIGLFVGIKLANRLKETYFRWFVLTFTVLGAILMVLKYMYW